MRWVDWAVKKYVIGEIDTTGLETARALRKEAEEKLAEQRSKDLEVRNVSHVSRRERSRNNFSRRITDTFRGIAHDG